MSMLLTLVSTCIAFFSSRWVRSLVCIEQLFLQCAFTLFPEQLSQIVRLLWTRGWPDVSFEGIFDRYRVLVTLQLRLHFKAPFQTYNFSGNLVELGIEPGTSGSVARNSDRYSYILCYCLILPISLSSLHYVYASSFCIQPPFWISYFCALFPSHFISSMPSIRIHTNGYRYGHGSGVLLALSSVVSHNCYSPTFLML
jgi:hypothetical protein